MHLRQVQCSRNVMATGGIKQQNLIATIFNVMSAKSLATIAENVRCILQRKRIFGKWSRRAGNVCATTQLSQNVGYPVIMVDFVSKHGNVKARAAVDMCCERSLICSFFHEHHGISFSEGGLSLRMMDETQFLTLGELNAEKTTSISKETALLVH